MYAPNAPDPHPSNTDDYTTDDLFGVVAKHQDAHAIMAGAFLDYARWITNWSPPEFEEPERSGQPRRGSTEWRRREREKKAVKHAAAVTQHQARRRVAGW